MVKEKALKAEEINQGCLHCSTARQVCPLDYEIAVGFGDAHIELNGKIIYDGEAVLQADGKPKKLRFFEMQARKKPGDWRFVKYGPLHGETYQRQGKNNWVCIESNRGFA